MKMFADIRRQQSLYIRQLEDKLSELLMYTTGQKHSEINCGIEQMRQWVDDWRQDVWGEIERLERELEESEKRETGLSIMLTSAQSAAETWERKYKEALSKLETTTWERDALKEDILRAQDKANDMQIELLDGEVHPTCDYSLYSALCDALSDVVAWENKELLEDEHEQS